MGSISGELLKMQAFKSSNIHLIGCRGYNRHYIKKSIDNTLRVPAGVGSQGVKHKQILIFENEMH